MKFFIEKERVEDVRMFGGCVGQDIGPNRIGILLVFWKWSLAIGWEGK